MRVVYSTFGRLRDFKDAGPEALVTYFEGTDKTEVVTTISRVAPCRVLNAVPVSQPADIRWDHNEKLKKGELTQRQLHGKLQPSWCARATYKDGQGLVVE